MNRDGRLSTELRWTASLGPGIPIRTGESAMPGVKTASKPPGKLTRQLLFSEALGHQTAPPVEEQPPPSHTSMADAEQGATMDRILQEISAVNHKLEGMDSAITSLTAEAKSMRSDIASFQMQVSGLDQRVTTMETQITSWADRDQELLHLHSKLIDLKDRSRRNNVHLEGAEIHSYLRETLPKLTDITFDPTLEFQRVHRLGPKRRDYINRPVQL
ncbi:hypothetical protein NDU88_001775 [Pleurodeles waltl]|uniref:Uncharacterized protein n=1 Tax=Pleurodeles waltl TaxID=8319 RepID=A0AAV7T0F9_PLEWA|nr:hypothetical protein NDU88_001775 [Pleurodeles waltl]